MAKLVFISDLHFGINGNNPAFHLNMELFYENVFFPYIREHSQHIAGIVVPGDVFHDRRKIDTFTAKRAREYFFTPLYKWAHKNKKQVHFICGNHDIYYLDNLETNSLQEFITNQNFDTKRDSDHEAFKVYTKYHEIPAWDMAFIPWITKSNKEEIMSQVNRTSRRWAAAHLGLAGFNYSKVQVSMVGQESTEFAKFEKVMTGHYHYKHDKGNISYLGSPTEQTWIDVSTEKGFHTFDTETGELVHFTNPYNIFQIVDMAKENDINDTPKFYRVLVEEDIKQSEVDKMVKHLERMNAIGIQVNRTVVGKIRPKGDNTEITLDDVEDTPQFIQSYVDDKEVGNLLISLYNRAVNTEV